MAAKATGGEAVGFGLYKKQIVDLVLVGIGIYFLIHISMEEDHDKNI